LIVLILASVFIAVEERFQWSYQDTGLVSLFSKRIASIYESDDTDVSATSRIADNKEIFFQLYKCLAVGYGMGGTYKHQEEGLIPVQVTSNYFLQMIMLLGVPAGLLFLWIYLKSFLMSLKLVRSSKSVQEKFIFTSCVSIFISLGIILSVFPYTNYFPLLYLFGFICGLIDNYSFYGSQTA
jgi:hypothetical protein